MRPPLAVPPPARAEEPSLSFSDPTADAVLRSADREAVEEAGGLCGGEIRNVFFCSIDSRRPRP